MPEPIKVTREQWDAARKRCHARGWCHDDTEAYLREVLGPRPGPDTPPDLRIGPAVYAYVRDGLVWVDTRNVVLLLPWLEDHLLPWLREQVGVVRDAG